MFQINDDYVKLQSLTKLSLQLIFIQFPKFNIKFDTLNLRQKYWHFSMTFSNAYSWKKIHEFRKISLKFIPKVQINNIPALV